MSFSNQPFQSPTARLRVFFALQSITSLSRFIARSTRAVTALALSAGLALVSTGAAHAQNVPIVRDAEIEALIRDYARPIFKTAGLSKSNINIVLVNDPAFNAFVTGRRMFINTGTLMTAETPNEIIGVIAHEAGHIAGRHQERLRDQLAHTQTMAIVAALLGAGAMVAGAATDINGLGAAGAGVVASGPEMARRSLLGYQRSEEATADRSAMTYLNATGQSAHGILKTFQRFQSALSLSDERIDPYQVSHPMPHERIANLETLARESPYFNKKDSEPLQQRHDMMRVKIAAYTQGQTAASRPLRGTDGLASRYGDAQSTYLFGDLRSALSKTDALIKSQPKNPYFHEMRGDILMKSNKLAAAAEAYSTAVRLDPAKSSILPIALGQAYLAMGTPHALKKAVMELRKGLERDRENSSGYRYLAQAYGMLGDIADADLATADSHYYSSNYQDAKIFAMRAQMKLQRGSPGWVRAQDIINYKAPSKKKK